MHRLATFLSADELPPPPPLPPGVPAGAVCLLDAALGYATGDGAQKEELLAVGKEEEELLAVGKEEEEAEGPRGGGLRGRAHQGGAVLRGLSFTFWPGELVAVTGACYAKARRVCSSSTLTYPSPEVKLEHTRLTLALTPGRNFPTHGQLSAAQGIPTNCLSLTSV